MIKRTLEKELYHRVGPYLQYPKGAIVPGWGIRYSQEMRRLLLGRSDESRELLREPPLRHAEKTKEKELALSIGKEKEWRDVAIAVQTLRSRIREQGSLFTNPAEEAVAKRRGTPTQLAGTGTSSVQTAPVKHESREDWRGQSSRDRGGTCRPDARSRLGSSRILLGRRSYFVALSKRLPASSQLTTFHQASTYFALSLKYCK